MILTLLQTWASKSAEHQAVLCSIVAWKGSVPRKDYPLMLVLDDGSILGTIGGGSMELQVIRQATELTGSSQLRLLDFDMTGADVDGDVGLCGGKLTVLVEPFTPELEAFYADLANQLRQRPKLMVCLSIDQDLSLTAHRELYSSRKQISTEDSELENKLRQIFEDQKSRAIMHKHQHILLWQPFNPPVIHIFGAGHVGHAVAELAHFNDLRVQVYDDRPGLLTAARFPFADRQSIAFPLLKEDFPQIDAQDFVLIASREHRHDHEILSLLLQQPPAYIGLVSSARKWRLLSKSLLKAGLPPQAVSRVKAPVGLNINGQTVPEIAVSILAEIIASYRGASLD